MLTRLRGETFLRSVKVSLEDLGDNVSIRESHTFEGSRVRCRHIGTSHSLGRSIEVIESRALTDLSQDFRTDTECWETTFNCNEVVSLLDGRDDGLDVQRSDRSQVDHFNLDTFLLIEDLGSLKTVCDHLGVRDNGDIATFSLDLGLADREQEVGGELLLSERERDTVHELVLEEADRVGVSNGGLQLKPQR